jgi:cytochrome bd-type quinol oxidase subunit 1
VYGDGEHEGCHLSKNKRTQKGKQEKKIFSDKNRFYGKITLFALSGAIMIGHGARMIYQGLFTPGSSYAPNTFDLFFDWLTLAILGCFILLFAISLLYHSMEKRIPTKKPYHQQEEKSYIFPT